MRLLYNALFLACHSTNTRLPLIQFLIWVFNERKMSPPSCPFVVKFFFFFFFFPFPPCCKVRSSSPFSDDKQINWFREEAWSVIEGGQKAFSSAFPAFRYQFKMLKKAILKVEIQSCRASGRRWVTTVCDVQTVFLWPCSLSRNMYY